MRVTAHDPNRPPTRRHPDRPGLQFTPFRNVKLNRSRELHIDIATGPVRHSVSARMFRVRSRDGAATVAGEPIHLFEDQLADLIATLTEAGAAMAAMPAPAAPEAE